MEFRSKVIVFYFFGRNAGPASDFYFLFPLSISASYFHFPTSYLDIHYSRFPFFSLKTYSSIGAKYLYQHGNPSFELLRSGISVFILVLRNISIRKQCGIIACCLLSIAYLMFDTNFLHYAIKCFREYAAG